MAGSENRDAGETLALMRQILEDHKNTPHGSVSRKDVINCNAFLAIRKILPSNLKIEASTSNALGPEVRTHCIEGCIHVLRQWVWPNLYDEPGRSPGCWWEITPFKTNRYTYGEDVISLVQALHSGVFPKAYAGSLDEGQVARLAALYQEGSSEEEVLARVIQTLKMDPKSPMLKMPPIPSGWEQSEWAYPSTQKPWEIAADRYSGVMFHHSPDFLPFMRMPSSRFDICDEKGRLQAVLASWSAAWGGNLMASVIPCHRKDDLGKQQWVVGQSARKLAPFGLEMVKAFPDARVVVDDDLHVVEDLNKKLRQNLSNSPLMLVGWPRCMFGVKPDDIEWGALGGRKVVFAVTCPGNLPPF